MNREPALGSRIVLRAAKVLSGMSVRSLKSSNRSIVVLAVAGAAVLLLAVQGFGDERVCLPLRLKPIHCARGIVIDQSGTPIDDVTVTLFKDGKMVATVSDQEDGKFSFDVSQPGNYEIEAKKLGYSGLRFPVVIVKPRKSSARILKVVLDTGGDPCSHVWLAKR
jgi:Carboxypeptidase regulatory-like domain